MGRERFSRIICANAIELCNIILSSMGRMKGGGGSLEFQESIDWFRIELLPQVTLEVKVNLL